MLTLYQFSTSPFCEKVRRILSFKGVPYTLHEVARAEVADYATISPTGKFPAILHDGHAVWDSSDIAIYLDKQFPDRRIIPAEPALAARVHIFEDWADESLYFYELAMRLSWKHNAESMVPVFMPTLPGKSADEVLDLLVSSAGALVRTQGIGRKPVEQIIRDAHRHVGALEDILQAEEWLVGSALTLADLAVAPQVIAILCAVEAQQMLPDLPAVTAWLARLDQVASA